MPQAIMCPICGTKNISAQRSDDQMGSLATSQMKTGLTFSFFSCEAGHVFLTVEESEREMQAIADSRLYERHRRN